MRPDAGVCGHRALRLRQLELRQRDQHFGARLEILRLEQRLLLSCAEGAHHRQRIDQRFGRRGVYAGPIDLEARGARKAAQHFDHAQPVDRRFARAGFDKVSSDLQAVAIGATNLLATIIAMSMIDRLGRKLLLLIGSVGTALCLAGVSAIFYTHRREDLLVWLLVGFIGFFAFSQGAVIWVYLSEVFPNRVRAKGQSLGSFTHWFMNALIAWTFPQIAHSSGGAPFALFSVMMALQFFVVFFVFPETKGLSLEQMQKKLGIH